MTGMDVSTAAAATPQGSCPATGRPIRGSGWRPTRWSAGAPASCRLGSCSAPEQHTSRCEDLSHQILPLHAGKATTRSAKSAHHAPKEESCRIAIVMQTWLW